MTLLIAIMTLLQGTIPEDGLYWVIFSDRGENLQARLEEASSRIAQSPSASRRATAGKLQADVYDLSPWAPYVGAVESVASAPVRVESRYLNAVSIRLTSEQAAELQNQPFVKEIRSVGVSTFQPEEGIPATDSYGLSLSQLQQINTYELQQRGWTGQGVTIGILDTGFEVEHPCLQSVTVLGACSMAGGRPPEPGFTRHQGTLTYGRIRPGFFLRGSL